MYVCLITNGYCLYEMFYGNLYYSYLILFAFLTDICDREVEIERT